MLNLLGGGAYNGFEGAIVDMSAYGALNCV
jgi:hypothetical protein